MFSDDPFALQPKIWVAFYFHPDQMFEKSELLWFPNFHPLFMSLRFLVKYCHEQLNEV